MTADLSPALREAVEVMREALPDVEMINGQTFSEVMNETEYAKDHVLTLAYRDLATAALRALIAQGWTVQRGLSGRELKLLCAAEDVLCRYSIVRASNGSIGVCGLPEALNALNRAAEEYPELDRTSPPVAGADDGR